MRMRSAWRRFSFRHSTPRAASRALRWNRCKALAAMSVETESLQGVARAQCRARNLNSANARLDKAARALRHAAARLRRATGTISRGTRSEERRVGKEGRTRGRPWL